MILVKSFFFFFLLNQITECIPSDMFARADGKRTHVTVDSIRPCPQAILSLVVFTYAAHNYCLTAFVA